MTTTASTDLANGLVAGTWTIDPSHSEVGFTVRHLMTKVRGHFEAFTGTITTGSELAETRASATIDLSSIDTRNGQRDEHLRSCDFFDVEQHGPMTFTTTSFDGTHARGDLTVKGVTREVHLEVALLGFDGDPWGGRRIGFEASATISRKDFGVDFNFPLDGGRLVIGDKVEINLSVQAVLDDSAEEH